MINTQQRRRNAATCLLLGFVFVTGSLFLTACGKKDETPATPATTTPAASATTGGTGTEPSHSSTNSVKAEADKERADGK